MCFPIIHMDLTVEIPFFLTKKKKDKTKTRPETHLSN